MEFVETLSISALINTVLVPVSEYICLKFVTGLSIILYVEYWSKNIISQYPYDTTTAKWVALFSDKNSSGPALLKCLKKDNKFITSPSRAAAHMDGLFSSLSGRHRSSVINMEDPNHTVPIASCLSGPQKKMLQCLCSCANLMLTLDVAEEAKRVGNGAAADATATAPRANDR